MSNKRILLSCATTLVLLMTGAANSKQSFSRIEDHFTDVDGTEVTVKVVSALAGQATLKVLYGPDAATGYSDFRLRLPLANKGPSSDRQAAPRAISSLDSIARAVPFRLPSSGERILLSGGFSGYRDDVPVGLLVSGGRVLSPVDSSPPRFAPVPGCKAAQLSSFRFSGLLCVRADTGAWNIVRTGDYKPGMCREAVQAGPLLVEPGGEPGICVRQGTAKLAASSRLAACIDSNRVLHFALASPTSLLAFSRWLARGPLKCDVALNLSGDVQAGWVELPGSNLPMPKAHGGEHLPLASALLLEGSTEVPSAPGNPQPKR
jgi:uncharacterized protein YigE (DUF2233 family)